MHPSFLMRALLLAAAAIAAGCTNEESEQTACTDQSTELYERRIEPILVDDRPKSCNRCHLSGIDLSLFVRETPCETMACMVELGLVDVEDPDASLVLSWIRRATPDSELITQDVIDAEHDAFREWIGLRASCGDDFCRGVTCGAANQEEMCEVVIPDDAGVLATEDCSELALERAFAERVFAWRGRCYPCHFDNTTFGPPEAPRWIHGSSDCNLGSLATMRNVLERELIDVDAPDQSLLLLKPLAESAGGVMHGGHDKFAGTDDVAYGSFLSWIEYYARCNR